MKSRNQKYSVQFTLQPEKCYYLHRKHTFQTITCYRSHSTIIKKTANLSKKNFCRLLNYTTSNAGVPRELQSRSSIYSEIPTGATSRSEELADIWLAKQVGDSQVFQASLKMTSQPQQVSSLVNDSLTHNHNFRGL